MGHKVVCFDCKKSYSQGTDFTKFRNTVCPECGKAMIALNQTFKPPKRTDEEKWNTVKYLVQNGFLYHHVYKMEKDKDGVLRIVGTVSYPENMREAKEFVEKYQSQRVK